MTNKTNVHIDPVIPDAVCGICYHPCEDSETCNRDDCPNRNEAVTKYDWQGDFKHENGNYSNVCGEVFRGYKRRMTCHVCANN